MPDRARPKVKVGNIADYILVTTLEDSWKEPLIIFQSPMCITYKQVDDDGQIKEAATYYSLFDGGPITASNLFLAQDC